MMLARKSLAMFLIGLTFMVGSVEISRADEVLKKIQEDVRSLGGGEKVGHDIKRRVATLEREADLEEAIEDGRFVARTHTHIRMNGGVPFPKESEVMLPPTASPNEESETSAEFRGLEYRKPAACEGSRTIREETQPRHSSGEERVLLDTLYVREGFVPVDAAEIYGRMTEVFTSRSQPSLGELARMRADDVLCIPYRIRVTNRRIYRDTGENALRNYDIDPEARGRLHPWVEKKLDQEKRR